MPSRNFIWTLHYYKAFVSHLKDLFLSTLITSKISFLLYSKKSKEKGWKRSLHILMILSVSLVTLFDLCAGFDRLIVFESRFNFLLSPSGVNVSKEQHFYYDFILKMIFCIFYDISLCMSGAVVNVFHTYY